jgi:hypothetical protein
MSHSKSPSKTKIARAKSVAKRSAKPERIPSASTGGGTKQEAVLALLREPQGTYRIMRKNAALKRKDRSARKVA